MKSKVLLIITAVALVCGCVVGGTMAWLRGMATVTNTFTLGEISITLTETTGDTYELVPGATVAKDPKVTVCAGSEACWLFVKIEEKNNLDTYISYTLADGWTALENGVYYRQQAAVSADVAYSVLKDDQITVKDTLTVAQATALKESGTYPTLKLTAYAVQQSGVADVTIAWEQAKNLS